ncbi:taste receptor type 2 member 10, partial [Silurus asotus]
KMAFPGSQDYFIMMDSLTFAVVNIPVSIISILINFFCVICMFFPQHSRERLRQPLNVLLGTLVACNVILQVCISVYTFMECGLLWSSNRVYGVIIEIILFSMRISVTSSLWLNVFYVCQIVPAECSVFICLKRNIKFFIYSAMIADKIFFMFGFSEGIALTVAETEFPHSYEYDSNATYTIQWDEVHAKIYTLYYIFIVNLWLRFSYLLLCLFVMLTSSCATILYLRKHMKSMEASSSSLSSPCLQRQMRVTITGIIQTFLYFLCSVWILIRDFVVFVLQQITFDLNGRICCSVVCLYSLGSTVNLCVGQKIFRERAVEI